MSGQRSPAILSLPVAELAAAIARREFSSLEVLQAYRARAEEVNKACNAVTYWFEDWEAAAKHADAHLQRTGETLGPLHGVPFTIKDHVTTAGVPTTLNVQTLRKQVDERRAQGKKFASSTDEPLVGVLRSYGAIPLAKTTMTQMGNTWGGGGPAFGDTLNPWDTLRTTGGSSCGEGALVGAGASPFGIGSDIGGSLRIPSAFCGICTLKPTTGRLALFSSTPGDYSIPATTGFMAKSVQELTLLYSLLFSARFYDQMPRMARIPFDHAELASTQKLRIGHYTEEYTQPKPCPTVRRAMRQVIEALKQRGHELVPFRPHSDGSLRHEEVRGADFSFHVSQRPPAPPRTEAKEEDATKPKVKRRPEDVVRALVLPPWVSKDEPVHPDLAENAVGPANLPVEGLEYVGNEGAAGYSRLMARRDGLRGRFHAAWRNAGIDVLLCPAWALPACQVEEVRNLSKIVDTTRIFNFLDMPAGVVPVTKVTSADLQLPYQPSHPDERVNAAALRCLEGSEGLPVGVQVVAPPWREELALRAMREVQACCRFEAQHALLQPTPRRSPAMGARPELLTTPPARL